nr:putative reverse transcriptase domain-containing protein [Tanacetum cinerariifolium]
GRMHDAYMFGIDDLEGNEVIVDVRKKIVEKEVSTADPVTIAGEVVTAASVEDSAAPTTATTADVDDELTLAKTLIAIKTAKPNVISTAATIVTTAITTPRAKENVEESLKKTQAEVTEGSSKRAGQELKTPWCIKGGPRAKRKANVVTDALSKNERIKPLRVRALVMTIGLDLPKQILNAQTKAQKPKNLKYKDVGGMIRKDIPKEKFEKE